MEGSLFGRVVLRIGVQGAPCYTNDLRNVSPEVWLPPSHHGYHSL